MLMQYGVKMSSENITEYFVLVPVKIDLKEGKVIEVETVTTAMADEIFNTSGFFTSREDAMSYLNDEEEVIEEETITP
jgi:hypothetical protein